MEVYIGTKIIKAEPMSKEAFEAEKNDCEQAEGNIEGYKVQYEDGYISWSPAAIFKRAYRLVTQNEKALF